MLRPLSLLLLFTLPALLCAQQISGISTRWGNSFVEWELFTFSQDSAAIEEALANGENTPEEAIGELKLRWLNLREDWSEWEFEFGELRGTIKMKWKNDPTQWELRTFDGDIVTMRAAWANDLTEWRITDNNITLLLRSKWKNQLNDWQTDRSDYGNFHIYQYNSYDPRDWAVDDTLDDNVSTPMRLAMVFITVFHSTPKS